MAFTDSDNASRKRNRKKRKKGNGLRQNDAGTEDEVKANTKRQKLPVSDVLVSEPSSPVIHDEESTTSDLVQVVAHVDDDGLTPSRKQSKKRRIRKKKKRKRKSPPVEEESSHQHDELQEGIHDKQGKKHDPKSNFALVARACIEAESALAFP
jgi:hypothetical protein